MPPPARRLAALDIFRGATMASMILVNNAGNWDHVYAPLLHKDWHGWTFTDTVFPFFLWIVGVAITLSTARRIESGQSRVDLLGHALRRAVIIFAAGFLLSAAPEFHWATIRIPGVLQRIAVCYLIAFLIFLWTSWRGQLAAIVGLNAVYWLLMQYYPVPGCGAGSYDAGCNFARHIDSLVLSGHMYSRTKFYDPEGIVSTLPAIATVLFGILAGHLLRSMEDPNWLLLRLGAYGVFLFCLGSILDLWIPINKQLWTTSYMALMAGLAMLWFGIWYFIADVAGWRRWLKPFEVFGSNAILIYILSGAIAKSMGRTGLTAKTYDWLVSTGLQPVNASLAYAILNVLACYLAAWLLWRRGWFVKF
jgi:predicted acyltransferase